MFLCSDFEGGESIGFKEMIFLSSGVSGVDAFKEEVTVPMNNYELKVVECGRYRREAVLPKVMLKCLDAIFT